MPPSPSSSNLPTASSTTFVLFVSSVDKHLTLIVSNLISLWLKGYLNPGFKLIIIDDSEGESYPDLLNRINNIQVLQPEYYSLGTNRTSKLIALAGLLQQQILTNIVFYWSLELMKPNKIKEYFQDQDLNNFVSSQRIHFVIESPYGNSYTEAKEINTLLQTIFEQEFIYRFDPQLFGYNMRLMSQLKQVDAATQTLLEPQNISEIKLQIPSPAEDDPQDIIPSYFTTLQILTTIGYDSGLDNQIFAKTEFIDQLTVNFITDSKLNITSALPTWEEVTMSAEFASSPPGNLEIHFQEGITDPIELSLVNTDAAELDELNDWEYALHRICKGDPQEFASWPEVTAVWAVIEKTLAKSS